MSISVPGEPDWHTWRPNIGPAGQNSAHGLGNTNFNPQIVSSSVSPYTSWNTNVTQSFSIGDVTVTEETMAELLDLLEFVKNDPVIGENYALWRAEQKLSK